MKGTRSGIYCIRNKTNGHRYIGQTQTLRLDDINLTQRWQEHRSCLRGNKHINRHLQAAWGKYGEEAFCFEIVLLCNVDALDGVETQMLNTEPLPEYNIARDGSAPHRGRPHSTEAKAKIAAANKGRKITEETRQKMRKPKSPGARLNMSLAQKGKKRGPLSPEQRSKLSTLRKGKTPSQGVLERARSARIAVEALSPDTGAVVLEFDSISAASAAGYNMGHICSCLGNRRKSHAGFIWRKKGSA